MEGGILPDLTKLSSHISKIGVGASLRGVEASISGRVLNRDGRLVLMTAGTREAALLAPLRKKIQWNEETGAEMRPSARERAAYRTLRKTPVMWNDVLITGPLSKGPGGRPLLQVRLVERPGSSQKSSGARKAPTY